MFLLFLLSDSPITVAEQHMGRADTKAGSHKTFNIIHGLLSHARVDNVTFKTTRECPSRKHISGNFFFFFFENNDMKRGKKLVGKMVRLDTFLLSPIVCWGGISNALTMFHISKLFPKESSYYSLSGVQDFELIGYHFKRKMNTVSNFFREPHDTLF